MANGKWQRAEDRGQKTQGRWQMAGESHRRAATATSKWANLGLNDGPAAGQTMPELHFHVIPRYTGDVPDPWRRQVTSWFA